METVDHEYTVETKPMYGRKIGPVTREYQEILDRNWLREFDKLTEEAFLRMCPTAETGRRKQSPPQPRNGRFRRSGANVVQ